MGRTFDHDAHADPADPAIGVPATMFDGATSRRHPVWLRLVGDTLVLRGETLAAPRGYPILKLRPAERWRGAPLAVALPDGGTLWLDDRAAALAEALLARAQGGRARWVPRVIDSWPAVVVSALCLIALVVWFDRQGAGLAANVLVGVAPRSVDKAVGDGVMEAIEKQWLAPTLLDPRRREAIKARFAAAAQRSAPGVPATLEFRRLSGRTGGDGGFNAFTLPNGQIVVLDGLVMAFTDDELMAVLGHELGHVVHRHGMHSVARSFGLGAVAAVVLGDFSSFAVATMATLQNFSHSRDAEREADDYGRRFIADAGLPPTVMTSVWRKFLIQERRAGATAFPAWLSTHPTTEERLRAAGVD